MLCDHLSTDPWPGLDHLELPVWLSKSVHEIKISRVTCEWFTIVLNDMQSHGVIYDWLAKTCDQRRIQLRVGSLTSEIDKFHDSFWQLKVVVELVDFNNDLLVSNIGGTYDLADQLPSNHEFGHFFVASQSQVPREFGVNLALGSIRWSARTGSSNSL